MIETTSRSVSRRAAPAAVVDVLIVGAGVFGLWTARRARALGLRTLVVETRAPGAGASGGVLGALTAHSPDVWNDKKAFQLAALLSLPHEIAALEDETGGAVGYRRSGRVMPIRSHGYAEQVARRTRGAARWWAAQDPALSYGSAEPGAYSDWLSERAAPYGVVVDTLAAQLDPRAYVDALTAAAGPIWSGVGFASWADDAARLTDGRRVAAGAVALCAGVESFPIIAAFTGAELGAGVKGQAAILRPRRALPAAPPLIYDDGAYVVARADGRVAVGSTSDADYVDAAPDPSDDAVIKRAQALCPALEDAALDRWWAGVRPKCRRRDPLVGRLPVEAPIWTATGGFKIGLGVAHRAAAALVDRLTERLDPTPLPATFAPPHHFAGRATSAAAPDGPAR